MIKRVYNTVKERLFWSYANLAMAHTAVDRNQEKYATFNYMIRAKLYKGLCDGTMNVRTLFDDEKIKLLSGQKCSYCGSSSNLALDHIFPQKFGGKDAGDNLIYACRSCNSSKGKKGLDESDEKQYWLSKTPVERIYGVEIMRQMLYGYDPLTTRLQRFFEIAELS